MRTTGAVGSQEVHRRALQRALEHSDLTLDDVWLRYFTHGGTAGPADLDGYLRGGHLEDHERDLLTHAVNERLDEVVGSLHLPPATPPRRRRTPRDALLALTDLLQGWQRALAGDLPRVVGHAARALDVRVVVYLVDYEQRSLVPFPAATSPAPGDRQPLGVEGTLPGRAFRLVRTQAALTDPQPRWWIPLLDGAERLGVLDVMTPTRRDLSDPLLRERCELLARVVGQLVTAAAEHGDVVESLRRTRERSPAGELVWGLLPPLTADTGTFSCSGLVQPAYDVGGDAFDYALAARHVDLAVFDAMGHSLSAGLIATTALSTYRAARRAGRSLYDQVSAVDDAVAEHFPDGLATGVLMSLDLDSGRLRYVSAGHPAPLLLRSGRVVGSLEGGRRTPFGVPTAELVIGEDVLQPGDGIFAYTDGVVEARDPGGEFFGLQRLADFLSRAASTAQPPAETVRRVVAAILEHQDGVLQDDATVLLAQWTGRR